MTTIVKDLKSCIIQVTEPLILGEFEETLPILSNGQNDVFERFVLSFATAYRNDNFISKVHIDYHFLKQIYNKCVSDKYSIEEFEQHYLNFIETNKYAKFNQAEFFQTERPKLYPESWKDAEKNKDINATKKMEAFVVTTNNHDVKMYRYYDPNNRIIKNPNIRIMSKSWDIGGHYTHQYAAAKEPPSLPGDLAEKYVELQRRYFELEELVNLKDGRINELVKICRKNGIDIFD